MDYLNSKPNRCRHAIDPDMLNQCTSGDNVTSEFGTRTVDGTTDPTPAQTPRATQ